MAKAKTCERCGKRFLAEPNEPQLCFMCSADDNPIEETNDDERRDSFNVSDRS